MLLLILMALAMMWIKNSKKRHNRSSVYWREAQRNHKGLPGAFEKGDRDFSVLLAAREARNYFIQLCPDSRTFTEVPYTVDPFTKRAYSQHSLTMEAQWQAAMNGLTAACTPNQHQYRMDSVSQILSGAFLRALPTQRMLNLHNLELGWSLEATWIILWTFARPMSCV